MAPRKPRGKTPRARRTDERSPSEIWLDAPTDEKERAIREATTFIDKRFRFRGQRTTTTQSLSWPRVGAVYDDGRAIESIPDCVKRATAELAALIVAGAPLSDENLAPVRQLLRPVLARDDLH